MQHGAHRIAARRLEVQPLGLAMCQLSHVGPTARVFLGKKNGFGRRDGKTAIFMGDTPSEKAVLVGKIMIDPN